MGECNAGLTITRWCWLKQVCNLIIGWRDWSKSDINWGLGPWKNGTLKVQTADLYIVHQLYWYIYIYILKSLNFQFHFICTMILLWLCMAFGEMKGNHILFCCIMQFSYDILKFLIKITMAWACRVVAVSIDLTVKIFIHPSFEPCYLPPSYNVQLIWYPQIVSTEFLFQLGQIILFIIIRE